MKDILRTIVAAAYPAATEFDIEIPERAEFGHYSTNIALKLSKQLKRNPLEIAKEVKEAMEKKAPAGLFEKIEVAPPGFVNFWLTRETLYKRLAKISADRERYGVEKVMDGKTVMIEYTDPNPFKLFHIGHLMPNTIGESLARLHEAVGAKVIRANYQGDVGLHVAKSVWAMTHEFKDGLPDEQLPLAERIGYLGKAYAAGSNAYLTEEAAKTQIEEVNKKIYDRSDQKVNELYDEGKKWSLEYFEEIYARLGTKFNHYFFESEVAEEGRQLVLKHKDIFTESDGAVVFKGEPYGLHTRVFINSRGLPTYEAKELGLNKKKSELYPLDLSIIVTGNEIVDYFKVLLKAMELTLPEVAKKTKHVPHGMLRLPSGKMSSRTGNVITADSLIEQTKEKLAEKNKERADDQESAAEVQDAVAIGAIKYSILKQNPGQDIVFDFDSSLSLHGDSGVYLQYTYARLRGILRKAQEMESHQESADISVLGSAEELALIIKIVQFPDVVRFSAESLSSSYLAKFLLELANLANRFYEAMPVTKEEDAARRSARVALVDLSANMLKKGLSLLGIQAPEKI